MHRYKYIKGFIGSNLDVFNIYVQSSTNFVAVLMHRSKYNKGFSGGNLDVFNIYVQSSTNFLFYLCIVICIIRGSVEVIWMFSISTFNLLQFLSLFLCIVLSIIRGSVGVIWMFSISTFNFLLIFYSNYASL